MNIFNTIELAECGDKSALSDLVDAACCDPLTGIFNRRAFFDATRGEIPARVALLDIKGLKAINEKRGYRNADHYIVTAVDLIVDTLGEGALIGRLGGDEFITYSSPRASSLLHDTAILGIFYVAEMVFAGAIHTRLKALDDEIRSQKYIAKHHTTAQ